MVSSRKYPDRPPEPRQEENSPAPSGQELNTELLNKGWIDAFRAIDTFQGENLLAQLTEIYSARAPGLFETLWKALQTGNSETAEEVAHALTSNSSSVGALHLSRRCAELEDLATRGELEAIRRLLPDIEAENRAVQTALEDLLDSGEFTPRAS